MKPKLAGWTIFIVFSAFFVLALLTKPQPLSDWWVTHQLHATANPSKRIALLNMSRAYPTNYWNQQYLWEATRANTEMERRFLADLIHERYSTNGILELRSLSAQPVSEPSKSNALAVISILENIQK